MWRKVKKVDNSAGRVFVSYITCLSLKECIKYEFSEKLDENSCDEI